MRPSLLTWTTGYRCFSLSANCLKSFGKTGRSRGGTNLRERDLPRFFAKRERVFVAMMHKRFGIETGNDDVTLLLEAGASGRTRQLNTKKRQQLSVVFGEKIVQALEEEPSMSGLNINISKIDVAKDLQHITVFWICKGDENDDLIDKALSEAAPKIRTRLSTHQIVGAMPAIKFVRDMSDLRLEEMNRIFATADYGMDYRAISQTAATLSPLSNSAPSSYVPPWLKRMKDKKQQTTDELIHSDPSLPKSE